MNRNDRFDIDLLKKELLDLASADALAAFFARLRYDTTRRTAQQAANLGISDAVAKPIRRIELLAERDVFQIYLVELSSVTIATTRSLSRAFRNLAGEFLLVLTSDYERIDFVFVDRLPGEVQPPAATRTFAAANVAAPGRPRILTLERRDPSNVALRVLRRFTWTEPDAYAQADKLRSAYAVAEWSEEEGLFNNRALFSDHYLKNRLREDPVWRDESVSSAVRSFRDLLLARSSEGTKDESSLRQSFFEPAFRALGFQPRRKRTTANDVESPDYELFAEQANEEPLGSCLTYPWMRYLDGKDNARDTERPDENPGAVVVSLLQKSDVSWVIVTNGKLWRLYSKRTHSRATSYFEVDLEEVIADATRSDPDPFRYFWLLFRREAFELVTVSREGREERVPFLDRLLLESADYAKELGDRLKERIFERVFPHLAEGFLSRWEEAPSEEDLQRTYRATLTLLYRVLFLLYAESRDLLPVREVRGYFEKSLAKLKREVADAAGPVEEQIEKNLKSMFRADSTSLYERLAELFAIVDQGRSDLNVPFYNGGLFATAPADDDDSDEAEAARFLRDHTVPDRQLAAAIELLSRDDDPKNRIPRSFIDYKSLGVRHLGSIYEGLLEFRLRIATERLGIVREKSRDVYKPWRELDDRKQAKLERDGRFVKRGQLYLENDKHERKATGSYYTPDYIVKYIVEHAVGPVVLEKLGALRPRLREAGAWHKKQTALAQAKGEPPAKYEYGPAVESHWRTLIDDVFDIKVLDPAMGSGHFLVEAVDFITDHIIDFLNAFPWNPVGAHLRFTRDQILESMQKQNVTIDPQKLTDVNLLKRHVLKRCIYGVDINPMAVELAKVSLWLHCFTLGAPLSFLDHHLRCGNSLVGVTVEEVDARLREGTQTLLFFGNKFAGVKTSVAGMIAVGEMPDITPDQVASSRSEYKRASSATEWAKRLLDVYTSQWFGNEPTRTRSGEVNPVLEFLGDKASELWAENPTKALLTGAYRDLVNGAVDASHAERFFHWQLEFPDVFLATPRADFDAVVGNPPYDIVSSQEAGEDLTNFIDYIEHRPPLASATTGKKNLYKLFAARSTEVAPKAALGFIVPMTLLGDEQSAPIRKALLNHFNSLAFEIFPQKDDPKMRVFPEAKLATTIMVGIQRSPIGIVARTHPGRLIESASPMVSVSKTDLSVWDELNVPIPSCTQQDWDLAMVLLKRPGVARLKTFASGFQGEVNETTDGRRGLLSHEGSSNTAEVIRGANVTRYALRDASQGDALYLFVGKFLEAKPDSVKAQHHKQLRVGWQESSPQNNFRRIIAALIPRGTFLNHLVNYIPESTCKIDLDVLLAFLNSNIAEWFFRLTSTNAHVSHYQIGALPIPLSLTDSRSDLCRQLKSLSRKIQAVERRRSLNVRSDRAVLSEHSARLQTDIDRLIAQEIGMSRQDCEYVTSRIGAML